MKRINENISNKLPSAILDIVRKYCGIEYLKIANSLRKEILFVEFFNSKHLDMLSCCLFNHSNKILNNDPEVLCILIKASKNKKRFHNLNKSDRARILKNIEIHDALNYIKASLFGVPNIILIEGETRQYDIPNNVIHCNINNAIFEFMKINCRNRDDFNNIIVEQIKDDNDEHNHFQCFSEYHYIHCPLFKFRF
jgi:hypothetical protein